MDGNLAIRLVFWALGSAMFAWGLALAWPADECGDDCALLSASGMRPVLDLGPLELPVIEPLPTDLLERVAYINIEADARLRCADDGGDTFIWNCRECPMRCFKSKCDAHGCYEGDEIWAVDP